MVAQNLLDTVFALPIADRIDLLERLRENLRDDPAISPLSEAHRQILDERLADFERDPTAGEPWEVVKKRLEARLARS